MHILYATGKAQAIRWVLGIFFLIIGCTTKVIVRDVYEKVSILYQNYKADFPKIPDLSVEELIKRQEVDNVILVDNREAVEREVSMIPGAVTDKEFADNIKGHSDATVVIYCTIGNRSGFLTEKLRKQEINAYNLKGGVLAWAHAGKKFVNSRGKETNKVHVYGPEWNLLPKGYEAVW